MRSLISATAVAGALLVATQFAAAQAPSGNSPFCLKSSSGATNCVYQTMAQCEQAKLNSEQCLTIGQAGGTVGQGNPPQPNSQRPPIGNQPPTQPPAQR
jgi:Protein of unknown function (DUF3551)